MALLWWLEVASLDDFAAASRGRVWRFVDCLRRLLELCLSLESKFEDFLEETLGGEVLLLAGLLPLYAARLLVF